VKGLDVKSLISFSKKQISFYPGVGGAALISEAALI